MRLVANFLASVLEPKWHHPLSPWKHPLSTKAQSEDISWLTRVPPKEASLRSAASLFDSMGKRYPHLLVGP